MDRTLKAIVAGTRKVINSPLLLGSLMAAALVFKLLADRGPDVEE
jgi:hypothetical protein